MANLMLMVIFFTFGLLCYLMGEALEKAGGPRRWIWGFYITSLLCCIVCIIVIYFIMGGHSLIETLARFA